MYRVKGSASYLYCEKLKHFSLYLQDIGAMTDLAIKNRHTNADTLIHQVDRLFDGFCASIAELENEIQSMHYRGK